MALAAILENLKIAIYRPRYDRFWRNLARWCSSTLLTVLMVKNLKFQKSKMAAAAIFNRTKFEISRQRFDRSLRNLARWRSSALVTVCSVTNLRCKEIEDGGGRHPNNRKITISRQRLKGLTDLHSIWHIMTHIGPPNQAWYSRTFVRQFPCVNFAYANS